MPRISKTQLKKGQVVPAQPQHAEEEVDSGPGCFNKSQWYFTLFEDEGEQIVADIMEEIVNSVVDKCYDVYIKKQITSYCVAWATNYVIDTMNCQFLQRNEVNDATTILALKEDTEPVPSPIDSWAVGCVPIINAPEVTKSEVSQVDDKDSEKKTEVPIKKPVEKQGHRARKLIPSSPKNLHLRRKPHPPAARDSRSSQKNST